LTRVGNSLMRRTISTLHAKLQGAPHNFHKDVSKKKPPAPYERKGLGTRWPSAFTRPTSNQVCVS